MPPKKKEQNAPNKEKVKIDKTFGMKNKKGARGQEKVALFKKQDADAGDPRKKKEQRMKEQAKRERKEAEASRKQEMLDLFKPVQVHQQVPFGVDPKTVLCINFKNGNCEKGARCKFSHDLAVGRKTQKKDIYTDDRKQSEAEKQEDNDMTKWDDEKLREVVGAKYVKGPTETDIVCKYFLEAIENEKYGWFWQCPNGERCHYKHALPKDFILNRDRTKRKQEEEEISIDEFIESERHKLGKNLTPVTQESFEEWKKSRVLRKEKEEAEIKRKAEASLKRGNMVGLSGKQMFELDERFSVENVDEEEEGDAWDLSQFRHATEEIENND